MGSCVDYTANLRILPEITGRASFPSAGNLTITVRLPAKRSCFDGNLTQNVKLPAVRFRLRYCCLASALEDLAANGGVSFRMRPMGGPMRTALFLQPVTRGNPSQTVH